MEECQVNFSIAPPNKMLIWLSLEIREFRENRANSARERFLHSLDPKETYVEAADGLALLCSLE